MAKICDFQNLKNCNQSSGANLQLALLSSVFIIQPKHRLLRCPDFVSLEITNSGMWIRVKTDRRSASADLKNIETYLKELKVTSA